MNVLGEVAPWYLSPTFLPAASGLFGVIVGGLITAGSSYLLEARRQKREQQKELAAQASTLRQAARLVDEDFLTAASCIQFALQEKKWGDVPILEPRIGGWEQYRTVLALGLSTKAWRSAQHGRVAIEQLIHLRAISKHESPELEKETLKYAEALYRELEEARETLIPFSATDPSPVA